MCFPGAAVPRAITLGALAWVLLVPINAARAERLPIKIYTTADGLAQLRVTSIVSDSRGFVWIGGSEGLRRFDGQRLSTDGVPQELATARINDFLESPSGAYWVATNGAGVYRFMPSNSGTRTHGAEQTNDGRSPAVSAPRLTVFHVGDSPQTDRVNAIHEDHAGGLWAGTDGGLFYLDAKADQAIFRRVELRLTERSERAVQIWAIAEDHDRSLWIGTSWGLVRRWPDGRIVHSFVQPAQGMDHVRALLVDREHRIWIGHDTGVIVVRPGTDRPSLARAVRTSNEPGVKLPVAQGESVRYTEADGLTGGTVRAFCQSSDGHVWIATLNGLTHFDGERFRAFTGAQGITRSNALAEDRQGNIWIGTLTGGAIRLARNGFVTYTDADGLAESLIGAIFDDPAGALYVVSNNQRIHRFDGTRLIGVRPNLSKDVADPVGPGIALRDRMGEWWIPGGAGLYRFPKVEHIKQLERVRHKAIYTTRDGLAGDDVFRLFEDSRGDIWIGRRTPTSFVMTRWERATSTFHRYSDADGLPAFNRILVFAEDHSGNVWIGFQNGGLARYRNGRFRLFTPADGAPQGGIGGLYVDGQGRLWVGSRRPALSRVDAPAVDRPRFVSYSAAQGLAAGAIGAITEDRSSRLYLALPGGRIDRLDPANGIIRHYGPGDGLTGTDLTMAFRDRAGSLWFGSYNGLFRLTPAPERPSSPPAVLIQRVRVAGENYLTSDLGETAIPRFELQPAQNQVQVDFFALGAGASEGLTYQYRLEGVDRHWNAPSTQREVTYSTLSPGSYRFIVRAITSDGASSLTPATMDFTILPPIWQRWWFRTAAVFGVTLILLAAHKHRVARLLALERVRMRIAADLHDDIGGSLSRISIQSEVACREAAALGDQPGRRLVEIADSARGLVDALGDVVWCVDPRRDDVASVCRRIREYADDLLPGSGVRWSYNAAGHLESIKLDPQGRRDLFLLLKEAVTNVARHSRARSASLNVELLNRELHAELKDDGCGFDPNVFDAGDPSDHDGVASMRARAERLGARLAIQSAPGAGTTLRMQLAIPRRWERMNMLLFRSLRRRRIDPDSESV
jgi:ligand-binding sensor domain-containing protein/signal transduction histidine kinase